jgi:hypothetical protein
VAWGSTLFSGPLWRRVVFADELNGAGLRALLALIRVHEKAHIVTDVQPIECAVQDAIAMHVDLLPVGCRDEAVALLGKEPCNNAVLWRFVDLCLAAVPTEDILELPPRRVERIADRHIHILVGMVLRRVAPHHDLVTWDLDVDAEMENSSLAMMAMSGLDNDAAAHDSPVKAIKLVDAIADMSLDRVGSFHAAKRDLRRELHVVLRLSNHPLMQMIGERLATLRANPVA